MHRILTKNYKQLINSNFNQYLNASCSYQTQSQLKKIGFKLQKETKQNTYIKINDKLEFIEQLKLTSNGLANDLKNLKWLKSLEEAMIQLKYDQNSYDLTRILSNYSNSNRTTALVDYILANFDSFSVKEKSLIFKILTLINLKQKNEIKNEKLYVLLQQLEKDYYNNIDNCDLIDFCNYLDGFYLFRDSKIHFYTASTEKIYRKSLKQMNEPNRIYSDEIDLMNKEWNENICNNNILLSLYSFEKLSYLTNDGKSIFFYKLITDNYDLLSNDACSLLSTLYVYNQNINHLKLSNTQREICEKLFKSKIPNIIENIHKIKMNKHVLFFIDWFTRQSKSDDLVLFNYKLSLMNYFSSNLKQVKTVTDLITNTVCLSILTNSLKDKNNTFKKSFYLTQSPLFNKLADKFVKYKNDGSDDQIEVKLNSKSNSMNHNKPNMKAIRENVTKNIDKLNDYFDLYSMSKMIQGNCNSDLKWISYNIVERFKADYSYNLKSMSEQVRQAYFNESVKISDKMNGIQLSKKVLDSILKEYVIASKEKSFKKYSTNKDLSHAIGLILNNHEYSVYKFNMLEPYINNLIDEDLTHLQPIIPALLNQFYLETFPGKTNEIFNRIRNKMLNLILNYSNTERTNLNSMNSILYQLYKAKNKFSFESNSTLDMSTLKKNLENLLAEFDNLCAVSSNQSKMKDDEISNLSDKVKQFEIQIFNYMLALKQLSQLIVLANDYNPKLLHDLTTLTTKLLSIFHDNLFTKVLNEAKVKRNYIKKSLVYDLMTMYGVYNYFDLNYLIKILGESGGAAEIEDGIRNLKTINDKLYSLIKNNNNEKFDLIDLADFNYSLLNLNIQCDQAIGDMFTKFKSFDDLQKMTGFSRDQNIDLLLKIVYFTNQNLCLKHKNSNSEQFFKDIRPVLPVDSAFQDVQTTLNSILGKNLVLTNPVYEYNFTAHFEIAIDENNNFVNPISNTSKYRIPILILDNSSFFNGVETYKKPISNYVENFKKLYPLVTVNSSKLEEMKSKKEKLDYIRERIINGLEDFAEK